MRRYWLCRILLFALVMGLMCIPARAETIQQGKNLVIGNVFTLSSEILDEERPIWVYLPDGYGESRDSYPVFYLLDGDIHFHHVSGIIDILSEYSHMPKMILVAVPNVDRDRDFLPTRENGWPPVAAADKFRAFLKKELLPLIDKKYRTRPFRILCGHSNGGTFCVQTFLEDPDLFTTYIAVCPGLHWDNELLLKQAQKVLKNATFKNKFLYLTTSADDEGAIAPTMDFYVLLESNSLRGLRWHFEFMEKDDHLSAVHPTIYNALLWLHKGWRLSESTLEHMTLNEVKGHYQKLSQRYGSAVPIPEGVLFNLGFSIQGHGRIPEAIEVFQYGIQLYPDSPYCYEGLGEVYEEAGNLELARKNYETALKLAEKNNDDMILPTVRVLLEQVLKKLENKQPATKTQSTTSFM